MNVISKSLDFHKWKIFSLKMYHIVDNYRYFNLNRLKLSPNIFHIPRYCYTKVDCLAGQT